MQVRFVRLADDTQVLQRQFALTFDVGLAPIRQFGNNLQVDLDIAQFHASSDHDSHLGISFDVASFHGNSEKGPLCARPGLFGMILIVRGHINTKTDKYVAR